MKLSKLVPALLVYAATASAASIDMEDPRRALGREGNVRIDAQLLRDSVSPGTPISVTYQIQNLSASPVAIAHKVTDASYDEDSRTITVVIGSEVPPDGNMPQMVLIAPGEKKTMTAAATPALSAAALRTARGPVPRLVQVKIVILRDLRPFLALIEKQDARTKQRLSDQQFEQWFDANDTIFLNAVPVYYARPEDSGIESRDARGSF